MEGDTLYLHLHKLSAINSEEALDQILTTLWRTRKTGLSSQEKSHFQSLLNLASPGEVDPVLACLRSLIRKCVRENFTSDEILKLLPPDLSLDLQSILIILLQKYQNQWKEEMSKVEVPSLAGQPSLDIVVSPRTSFSYQVKSSMPPPYVSFPSSVVSTQFWPQQDVSIPNFNHSDIGASTSVVADTNVSSVGYIPVQPDLIPPQNLGSLPVLKSMTWTMEKSNYSFANTVAVISLKLHDYDKSPSGEVEVIFQLTKDTLEAMLRSLTYISEQLSSTTGIPSGPAQKKQKQ